MPSVPGGDKDCWLHIFDDDDFSENDAHTRLQGPIELPSLRDLGGKNWANDISSLIVGPNAVVRAYSERNYSGTEIGFLPEQRVADLSDLRMGNTIESLKITCGNPVGSMGAERSGMPAPPAAVQPGTAVPPGGMERGTMPPGSMDPRMPLDLPGTRPPSESLAFPRW